MRILCLVRQGGGYLKTLYHDNPELLKMSYRQIMGDRLTRYDDFNFMFYKYFLEAGLDAHVVVINDQISQMKWLQDNDLPKSTMLDWQFKLRRGFIPWFIQKLVQDWQTRTLIAQVKTIKPDIIFVQNVLSIPLTVINEIKKYTRLVVGRHGAVIPDETGQWSNYDLVISPFKPTTDWFQQQGVQGKYLKLGFEASIVDHLQSQQKKYPIIFAGSIGAAHHKRQLLVEDVARTYPEELKVWMRGIHNIDKASPIHDVYQGTVFGISYYEVLQSAKIVLNHHGSILPFAHNLRLYEATGVGSLLLTDDLPNLDQLFNVGQEVVAYDSNEQCLELIGYYLKHDDEREAIAKAGQKRTLAEHTYQHRMHELVDILTQHLS